MTGVLNRFVGILVMVLNPVSIGSSKKQKAVKKPNEKPPKAYQKCLYKMGKNFYKILRNSRKFHQHATKLKFH